MGFMCSSVNLLQIKNKILPSDMRVRIQTTPTGRGGGDCVYQFFLLGNK